MSGARHHLPFNLEDRRELSSNNGRFRHSISPTRMGLRFQHYICLCLAPFDGLPVPQGDDYIHRVFRQIFTSTFDRGCILPPR